MLNETKTKILSVSVIWSHFGGTYSIYIFSSKEWACVYKFWYSYAFYRSTLKKREKLAQKWDDEHAC